MSWRLRQIGTAAPGHFLEVTAKGLTFGRAADNDAVLEGARYPGVSAHHARVVLHEGAPFLEDLGSRNGTLVDGERIERHPLQHGAVFQLGPSGPRFAVYGAEIVDETVFLPGGAEASPERSFGTQTMFALRKTLGIPEGSDVEQLVARRSRRILRTSIAVVVLLAAAVGVVYWILREEDRAALAALREETEMLATRLEEAQRAVETQKVEARERQARFDADRRRLEAERDALATSIRNLEEQELLSADELKALKRRLELTSERLDLFDPVNLEQEQLQRVAGFEDLVCMIEASLSWKEDGGARRLHLLETGVGFEPNLDGYGELFEERASGSGFCVSPEGWIITNAHVVLQEEDEREPILFSEVTLRPELELWVTFSGETERHRAELVRWLRDDRQDVAVVKIEGFEGMPYLEEFTPPAERPALGTEVYMIGFPGGKAILQEGDRVLASTFKGIVSRSVEYYIQIDAAVHPGVSGGPVIDRAGNLIGVVTGMHVLDERANSSAIGYVIPIQEIGAVWPGDG